MKKSILYHRKTLEYCRTSVNHIWRIRPTLLKFRKRSESALKLLFILCTTKIIWTPSRFFGGTSWNFIITPNRWNLNETNHYKRAQVLRSSSDEYVLMKLILIWHCSQTNKIIAYGVILDERKVLMIWRFWFRNRSGFLKFWKRCHLVIKATDGHIEVKWQINKLDLKSNFFLFLKMHHW